MTLVLTIAVIALCTWGGGRITSKKGRGSGLGMLLGFFLGPIGVAITLFLSDKREQQDSLQTVEAARSQAQMYRECLHCKEQMRRDASVCPHCRMESKAWTLHEGTWWSTSDDGSQYYLDEEANQWRLHEAVDTPADELPEVISP